MKYDTIIVGAGPAGIFTALELRNKGYEGSILIIEKGSAIENRKCPKSKTGHCASCKPCHITTGFSGAGAFSDGKLSLNFEVGGDLPDLIGEQYAQELIDYADQIYLSFGADHKVEGVGHSEEIKDIRRRAIMAGLKLVDCPIRHLGTEKAQELYYAIEQDLLKKGVEMRFQTECLDLLIKNGTVCDGTGAPAFTADIGITGDKITYIGRELSEAGQQAGQVIDASELTVTPGFIDPHTHVDQSVLTDPAMEPYLKQGVTTVVTGNCGYGMAPQSDEVFYCSIMDEDFLSLSGADVNEQLDVVQFNHYEPAAELARITFCYDFLRTIKDKPFWVTETQVGWNGSTFADFGYRPEGACYINTWLPVARGGEMVEYWLFRAHPNGHELAHGALFNTAGRAYRVTEEVSRAAAEFEKCRSLLTGSEVRSRIAIHYSSTSVINYVAASMLENFDYRNTLIDRVHAAFRHYNVDVIETNHALDGYDVLFSPFLSTVDEKGLKERVIEWVKAGGTWVVGPMSDIMTEYSSKYANAPYSFLEELAGVYTKYELPVANEEYRAKSRQVGGRRRYVRALDLLQRVRVEGRGGACRVRKR